MNISQAHLTTGTQSPFLPGTKIQFAWDSTSLGLLKTCPRLYEYVMLEGWGSEDESVHLRFGREYHAALEHYDRLKVLGDKHEDALHSTVLKLIIDTQDYKPDPDTKAGKYKSRSNLVRTVVDYLDHFQDDPAKTYVLENNKPAVELSFRFELDWGPSKQLGAGCDGKPDGLMQEYMQPYILCGHLDRVVDFQDQLYVMDRKTTTTTPSDYFFNQFEPNNQMSLYSLAGATILGSTIKGVIIDAAQILVDSSRFVRGFTYRTGDQLTEWLADLRVHLANAEAYANAGYWPMNDTACDKFGGCKFREICSKAAHVREAWLKGNFTKLLEGERWNPLKPR